MDAARPTKAWKYALIPIVVMTILALYPQFTLWIGKDGWQGAYFVSNYDEVAYSAYVNSLIDGKPRRNDPFTGVDDAGQESLYSIQFIPAYAIALPARLLGVSASTAFILLIVPTAIFSALALFWLINAVTANPWLGASGTLVILCFGTAAAFQGELRFWVQGRVLVDFLPFLRRYQPGFAFPIFFLFCGLVWRGFSQTKLKRSLTYSVGAGILFVVLVFSYFYLWTAAAAWLGCLTLLNLVWNAENRPRITTGSILIAVFGAIALAPYFIMLANRAPLLDSVQLLTNSHMPEFASPSLLIGLIVAAVTGFFSYRNILSVRDPKVLLVISFALTPFILFNQQVITGRSLQPVHYEIFIANYLVLLAITLLTGMVVRSQTPRPTAFIYVAALAAIWGMIEVTGSTGRNAVFAGIRDQSIPAIQIVDQNKAPDKTPVVLATNFITSDFIPSVSSIRPLWNPHTSSAGGVSIVENKRLFYLYLYYSGFTGRDLDEALRKNVFEVIAAIFGSERALPALGQGNKITADEIKAEVNKYETFVSSFNADAAGNPILDYIIVPEKAEPNYGNLDRWYQRDAGKSAGLFKVYKLTPKI